MHVVMVSDAESHGGAAIAAGRLATALCQAGHRVTRVVFRSDGEEHPWETIAVSLSDWGFPPWRFVRRFDCRATRAWGERISRKRLAALLGGLRPDVISVHGLHAALADYWSPRLLYACARYAPTVLTLHDMWSFTGGCAYSYDCRKFLTGCDAGCAHATEYPLRSSEGVAREWRRRQRLFSEVPLTAVAPSRWMAREAQAGLWRGHGVAVIPNGLPLDAYRPVDAAVAREALGITTPAPVILCVAQNLRERRKGYDLLKPALEHVSVRPLTLLTMGGRTAPVEGEGIEVVSLGYVEDERMKVLAYSAADLLVHPAPVDNLPNGVVEAMACGTPAVAFPVGGLPELVRPGVTGWLARDLSPAALGAALDAALNDLRGGISLRASCRAVAEREYGAELQARRYAELFEAIRQERPTAQRGTPLERISP